MSNLALSAYCGVTAQQSQVSGAGVQGFQDDGSDFSALTIFTAGAGAGQANYLYEAKAVSIAASGNTTLDLSGGLLDVLGNSLVLTAVKGIYITADATNTNDVLIGPGASNPFTGPFGGTTPTVAVRPGGKAIFIAPSTGWTVTAGTGDIIKIANSSSGTAVLFTIRIWGI